MSEIPYMMVNTRAEFERVRDLAWPVTDRTAATDAEFRSRIAPFEAAPTPPEVVDAVVAEIASRYRDPDGARFAINDFRDWLDDHPAAVTAYRAQDGGAEEAVRRVERLAVELDREAETAERVAFSTVSANRRAAARRIRAALAPQAGDGAR